MTGSDPPAGAGSRGRGLRVAVVGPTHPYKGGVAAHTTTLAHELSAAGHDVTLVSWSHLYPARLYPGEQAVPGGAPDVAPYPGTVRALSWARPDTWLRTGRRLRDVDVVVVVHVVPAVVPAHLALLRAAGALRTSTPRRGPRAVVIAHNVLPHEPHPGASALIRALLGRVDGVLVHSTGQAQVARDHGASRVVVADLPPHLPGGPPAPRPEHSGPPRLLALGLVREYKGLDVLLRALARVPGPSLTVAGEMWGEAGRAVRDLAADPALHGRVDVRGGYVPADRIAALLARHDVLALTYRSATASQNVLLGQRHGLAVLASDVGTFATQLRDGVDGLLVPAGDEDALVAALRELAAPGRVERMRAEVRPPDLAEPWRRYVTALAALAAPDDPRARPRAGVTADALPPWVRVTDVLPREKDAATHAELARTLGLTGPADPAAAWAALGALAAVLRLRGPGPGDVVVVVGPRAGSPFARWARAAGLAPVEVDTAPTRPPERPAGADARLVPDLGDASIDALTLLHPNGCTAADVDAATGEAARVLRPGGLLCVTLPTGGPGAPDAVAPADLRAVLARAADLGLLLLGDIDGDLTPRLRRLELDGVGAGLVLLTLRRR